MKPLLFLKIFFLLTIQSLALPVSAQLLEFLDSGHTSSIRGLSIYKKNHIGVSGNKGFVGLSKNGGKTWKWQQVKGYENRDFRDIHLLDKNRILIMAIDTPAIILKSKDGGKHWRVVFSDNTPGMFLDAMDFSDPKNGIVIGDPIGGLAYIATTDDGGDHWIKSSYTIPLTKGEAFFASSGSNIHLSSAKNFYAVSGGKSSHFINPIQTFQIPIIQGKESTGGNSIAIEGNNIVIVGGDFMNDKDTMLNCIISLDKGVHFQESTTHPHGYRSCVKYIGPTQLVACGTSGIDISKDGGKNWELIGTDSFHVCESNTKTDYIYFAGSKGRIARIRKDLTF